MSGYTLPVRFLLLITTALTLVACYPSMRQAKRTAEADFECDNLTVRRRGEDSFAISGCGRSGIYQCPTDPGVSSRYCVNLVLMAKNRAEEEFGCDELTAREISPFIFRVEGCGSEASYHCEASGSQPRCLREADPVTSEAPEPAAPAE